MSQDYDRRDQKKEDYWYYRNRDWDRIDDAKKTERDLEILRGKLDVGGRQPVDDPDDGPAESAPDVTFEALLAEKTKLLKKIASIFEAGEKDELYRSLDKIRLSDSTADSQLDQLLRLLAKRMPSPPADNRPRERSRRVAEDSFNILEILAKQTQQKKRQELEALRVDIAHLRSEWRLSRSGS